MPVEQLPPKKTRDAARDAKLVRYEEYIDTQITSTRRLVKAVDATTVLLTMAVGTLGFLLAAAIVEHWFVTGGFSFLTRTILFASLFSALGYYAIRRLWPLAFRPINPVYAAHTIEQGSPSLKNSLLNLLLFRQQRDEITDAVYETLEEQAAQRLTRAPVEAAVDRTYLLRLGYVLMGVVLLCALYKIASPKDPLITARRVLMPWADVVPASRVSITNVEPGTTTLARGDVLTVSADVQGIGEDDPVIVRYSTSDGQAVDKTVQLAPTAAGLRFVGQVPAPTPGAPVGIAQDLRYRVEAGDARSLEYRIQVVATPTISVERIDYDYPDYTGFADREVDNLGDIRAIEGTKVTIHARANEPIEEASVDFEADGRRDLVMTIDDSQAQAPVVLALRDDRQTPKYTSYVLRFTTIDGRKNSDPVKYAIDVLPDYAPEVAITSPRDKLRDVRLDETVAIDVEARDPDFALAEVRLECDVAGRKVLDQPLLAAEQTGRFTRRFQFTPSEHNLHPGDVIHYWAEARDNRRPQIDPTTSELLAMRIVSPDPNQQPPPDRVAQRDKPQQQPNSQPQKGEQQGEQQQGGESGESGNQSGEQSRDSQGNQQQGESKSGDQQSGNQNNSGQGQSESAKDQNSGEQSQADSQSQSGNQSGGQSDQQSGEKQSGVQQSSGNQSAGEQGNEQGKQSGQEQQQSGGNSGGQSGQQSGNQSQQSSEGNQGGGQSGQQRGNSQPSGGKSGTQGGDQQREGNARGQRPSDSQSKSGQRGNLQQSGASQQQKGANGNQQSDKQSPVSSAGDNDGEAFERIQKYLDKQGQSTKSNDSQDAGRESNPNTNDSQGENSQSEAKPSNSNSQSKDAQQGESASAEGESGEKSGATTRPGDQPQKSNQPPNGDQQDSQSPGGQQTSSKGESGAGDKPQDAQGSPDSQQNMKPGEKWQQKPSGENPSNNQEPPSGGRGKRESDSQGGQGGDRAGGGEEGGGQKANREGTGSAGQNQSADEGAGESSEQGTGNNSQSAGQDAASKERTGQPGSDQRGPGSSEREGQGDQQGGKPSDDQNSKGGGKNSPTNPNNKSSAGEPASADGQQSATDNNAKNQNSHDKNNDSQQQSGQSSGGTPTGDANGVPEGAFVPPKSNGIAPAADAANLEYARKHTDLVLESLADQLRRKKVDKQLLEELGWSAEDLQRFIDRWQQLKQSARGNGPEADSARRELDDALRSLGLRSGPLQQSAAPDDNQRNLRQSYRGAVPLEYQERLRAYNQGVSRARPDGE